MLTETFRPTGAGDKTELTPHGGSGANYLRVDEVVADEATTSLRTTSPTYVGDLYTHAASTADGQIASIIMNFRCQTDSDPNQASVRAVLKIGSTEYPGTARTLTNGSWVTYTTTWLLNPATGLAWLWSAIDALQFGVDMRSPHSVQANTSYFTQVYLEVNYAIPSRIYVNVGSKVKMEATVDTKAKLIVSLEGGG